MNATEKDTTYNGWTNYETWNVKLWMDNDEGSYHHYKEIAEQTYRDAAAEKSFTRTERATLTLADALKDEYENAMADWLEESKRTASVWADLIGAALSEVNWHEIAGHLIDDAAEVVDAEEKT